MSIEHTHMGELTLKRYEKKQNAYRLIDKDEKLRKEVNLAMWRPGPVKNVKVEYSPSWKDRPVYRTGDGDSQVAIRPGAMDFMKCESKGF